MAVVVANRRHHNVIETDLVGESALDGVVAAAALPMV